MGEWRAILHRRELGVREGINIMRLTHLLPSLLYIVFCTCTLLHVDSLRRVSAARQKTTARERTRAAR